MNLKRDGLRRSTFSPRMFSFRTWRVLVSVMLLEQVTGFCLEGRFGVDCEYNCHCALGTQCSGSGLCPEGTGCSEGWAGPPHCQTENIALGKLTFQQGTRDSTSAVYTWGSSLAVDGIRTQNASFGSCSWATDQYNVFRTFWFVDLGIEYSTKLITIYFRTDEPRSPPRRAGIQLFVSNTTNNTNGKRCYQDNLYDNFFPPAFLPVICEERGRYIILYNERPQVDKNRCPHRSYSCWANLELCEVEVYACTNGTYGNDCGHFCHCLDTPCHQVSGLCPGSCQPGWMGTRCEIQCQEGNFGVNCTNSCGHCLGGSICDRITGECTSGCAAGWQGSKCLTPCPERFYGTNCQMTCGSCNNCDSVTGACVSACWPGWTGNMCSQVCTRGFWGAKCQMSCGHCTGGATCDAQTGSCPTGCSAGYTGHLCTVVCSPGTYGEGCKSYCGHCDVTHCNHVTGSCEKGCKPGWSGKGCFEACPAGTYGQHCRSNCGQCINNSACDPISGACPGECNTGWMDRICKTACRPGTYGDNCKMKCAACAGDCDHVTGYCHNGCLPGWMGEGCFTACQSGYFGESCTRACGFCLNDTCHHVAGECPHGCDEGFGGERCLHDADRIEGPGRDDNVATIGGAVGGGLVGLCIIAILILLALKLRKRAHVSGPSGSYRKSGDTTSNTNETVMNNTEQDSIYVNTEAVYTNAPAMYDDPFPDEQNGEESSYYNLDHLPHGIILGDLDSYIEQKKSSENGFKDEFSELPSGAILPHEVGKRPANKSRNKYLTTFPYDHSRVVLSETNGDQETNYINANYIDSLDRAKVYIATQGPTRVTVNDFWRMVWQENCGKIVMLTNLVETGKVKCECYWPGLACYLRTKDFMIGLNTKQEYAFCVIRTLEVTNTKTNEKRKVNQFHFTTWPDHGVPDSYEIVSFHHRVQRVEPELAGPLIVHCSAGIGRTGTFIALDALRSFALQHERIDFLGYVRKMRGQRMNMIQTVDQYELLHVALLEAIRLSKYAVPSAKFDDHLRCHESLLDKEFETLSTLRPKYTIKEFRAALIPENANKNRFVDVLPVEMFRPYLSTNVPGTTDYINAISAPSLRHRIAYLMTQIPLKHTVADFWRLIYDHDCNTIVALNNVDEDDEDCGVWWPSEGEATSFGPLTINTVSVHKICENILERKLKLSKKGCSSDRTLKMFTLCDWPQFQELPASTTSVVSLLEVVDEWQKSSGGGPITVQCLNGATCSGVFCAIRNVAGQLLMDDEVSVYHIVRQLQFRRPEIVKTVEQYRFIYKAALAYNDSVHIYANM